MESLSKFFLADNRIPCNKAGPGDVFGVHPVGFSGWR